VSIDASIPVHILTFAAENSDEGESLIVLLDHPSPVVREGALYGLAKLNPTPLLREAVARHTQPHFEASEGVRAVAGDMMAEWGVR
jgi:hypothetical protein